MKDRIKQIRKNNNLTQTEFGERLGVKGNTVTNYENGLRNPSDAIIFSICREFNINEEWLRTGEGEMYSSSSTDFIEIASKIDIQDPKAKQAILDYWNLSDTDKELFWKFMEKFMQK